MSSAMLFAKQGEFVPLQPWSSFGPCDDAFCIAPGFNSESAGEELAPADPLEAAYAAGREEGMRLAEERMENDRQILAAMLQNLPEMSPQPTDALARVLALTVHRLVSEIMGTVAIDPQFLEQRAATMAAFVERALGPIRLHIHPDDKALLQTISTDTLLVCDPNRPRGSLLLETGQGWIEDGPELRLATLKKQLDMMAEPV
ncbi:MAG: flagellar biosynthesis protein [Sphingopyxis sp.]